MIVLLFCIRVVDPAPILVLVLPNALALVVIVSDTALALVVIVSDTALALVVIASFVTSGGRGKEKLGFVWFITSFRYATYIGCSLLPL